MYGATVINTHYYTPELQNSYQYTLKLHKGCVYTKSCCSRLCFHHFSNVDLKNNSNRVDHKLTKNW